MRGGEEGWKGGRGGMAGKRCLKDRSAVGTGRGGGGRDRSKPATFGGEFFFALQGT